VPPFRFDTALDPAQAVIISDVMGGSSGGMYDESKQA
jgi:hypothetical protein